jgi:hypothetical protein
MSTEQLDKFNRLYAEFLSELIIMHSAKNQFVKTFGRPSFFLVRRHQKKAYQILKEIYKVSGKVYQESRENSKAKFAKKREERAYKKANPLKRGRPRKNERNNNTTSNSV